SAKDVAAWGARGECRIGRRRPGDPGGVMRARLEGRRHAAEHAAAVVLDWRGLPVHQGCRTYHGSAECDANPLMTEAHAEHGHARTVAANDLDRDARVLRPARSWRDHDPGRPIGPDAPARHFVVAADDRRRAQLAEVLRQIPRERIVVVDEQNHRPASAMASACNSARALSRVSSYSAAGFESATMPAPACTRATPSRIVIVRIAMRKSRLPAKS